MYFPMLRFVVALFNQALVLIKTYLYKDLKYYSKILI